MASKWSKLKSKVKSQDLDDEFEKFLNESLSDESVSPHRSVTPVRTKSKLLSKQPQATFEKPWWATSEDSEDASVLAETAKKLWLKEKVKENVDLESTIEPPSATKASKDNPLAISRDSLDFTASRPGTALDTILSEPEYSSYENSKKETKPQEDVQDSEEISDRKSFDGESTAYTDGYTDEPPGMETLEEIKDKEMFFSNIEKNMDGTVDYKELNQNFSEIEKKNPTPSPHVEAPNVDATVEIEGLTPYRPPYYDSSSDEGSHHSNSHKSVSQHSYSHKSDEISHHSNSRNSESQHSYLYKSDIDAPRDTLNEDTHDVNLDDKYTVIQGDAKATTNAPNLLSRVGLMESLDSTGGVTLAAKLSKVTQNTQKELPSPVDTDNNLRTGKTTGDYTEALQRMNELSTQSSIDELQNKGSTNIISDNNNIHTPVQSGMLVLDKKQTSSLKLNEFTLQPVISSFADQPKVIDSAAYIQDIDGSQSFLGKVHHFEMDNTESKRNEIIQEDLEDDSRGFALQPILTINNESEEDSPPTESLKSIKSIAQERKKKILQKTKVLQKDMITVSETINKKKTTLKAKKSSIPTRQTTTPKSKTNTLSKRASQSKQKPSVTSDYSQKIKFKKTGNTPQKKTALKNDNLLASVESFATYLKDFTETNDVYVSPTAVKKVSRSFTIDQDGHLASLDREQSLQKELQHLRLAYDNERKRNEQLNALIKSDEFKYEREKDRLCFEYDKRLKELHEEVFILQKKLEMKEDEIIVANDVKGKTVNEISEEELKKMQLQLEQQESLLSGYQQENERLYDQVKKHQIEKKKFEGKMYKDTQQMASQIGNLKEELEAKPNFTGSASLGANRITQLDNQVKFYQKRETEYKQEILNFENEVSLLKRKLNINEKEKNAIPTERDLLQRIETMKDSHQLEIQKLEKRLNWYSENQQLIDRDLSDLKDKRDEIKELRELVDRMEKENKKLRKEKNDRTGERSSDGKKIVDLQRQVKEMEEIIRRRHPNSIPAMIYAASAIPGESKIYESTEQEKSKPMNIFLEKRVKALEKELEENDFDNSKKVRAIEQRYTSMSIRYEEHIKQLEVKIADLILRLKSEKTLEDVELEVVKTKKDYEELLKRFQDELKDKDGEIVMLKLELNEKSKQKDKKAKSFPSLQKDVSKLREKLRSREREISELHTTVLVLQKEREHLLTRTTQDSQKETFITRNMDNYNTERKVESKRYLTDRTTSPMVSTFDWNKKCLSAESENKKLKNTIEELRLECEEKRLKYEALAAEQLHETRTVREGYDEMAKKKDEEYKHQLEKLKMEFVVEHSNSKVAELNGKTKGYELMIEHLKSCLEESKDDRDKLQSSKLREETLRQQIQQLQAEIQETRKYHTPEMHHYETLQSKIKSMETRHVTREKELQNIIEKNKFNSSIDISHIEDKWRDILRNKDVEIQHFREELDSILEVLEELQRQGVILPNNRMNTHF